jgi:hypothetical protein
LEGGREKAEAGQAAQNLGPILGFFIPTILPHDNIFQRSSLFLQTGCRQGSANPLPSQQNQNARNDREDADKGSNPQDKRAST